MYVNVVWKNNLPGRRGDSEVIECDRAIPSGDRLNCFEGGDEYPFVSVALDQVMLWEIVDSSEAVKPPEPDETLRLLVTEAEATVLTRGRYAVHVDAGRPCVDLPLYFVKE